MKTLAFLAFLFTPAAGIAQTVVELRVSTAQYRFADFTHTFANKITLDALVVGGPDNDELLVGVGRQWQVSKAVSVTPLVYAVAGRAEHERGFTLGSMIYAEAGGWKTIGFLAHFVPVSGNIPHYTYLDSFDVTKQISPRWDLGASAGFFRIGGQWNSLLGPMVRRVDHRGYWALSARAGPQPEVRLSRVLTF